MLSKGQLVTFTLQITSSPSSSGPQYDLNAIQDNLGASGITVISSTVEPGLSGLGDFLSPSLGTSYNADFQIVADQDYGSVTDFLSVIENGVYQVTGNSPSIFGNPVVSGLSSATPPPPPSPSFIATETTGFSDTISNFFSGLSSATVTILWVLAGIVVLVLVLAAYGPNVGAIARAAA